MVFPLICHLYIYYIQKIHVYSFEYDMYLNVSMFLLLIFMFSFHVFPQHRISILKSWSQEVTWFQRTAALRISRSPCFPSPTCSSLFWVLLVTWSPCMSSSACGGRRGVWRRSTCSWLICWCQTLCWCARCPSELLTTCQTLVGHLAGWAASSYSTSSTWTCTRLSISWFPLTSCGIWRWCSHTATNAYKDGVMDIWFVFSSGFL